jgi:hypothetical protein
LPTPLVPTKSSTPIGVLGLRMPAVEARIVSATVRSAISWPRTRARSVSSSWSTAVSVPVRILPTGTPVHPATTRATTSASTSMCTMGDSPCTFFMAARSSVTLAFSFSLSAGSLAASSSTWAFFTASTAARCSSQRARTEAT